METSAPEAAADPCALVAAAEALIAEGRPAAAIRLARGAAQADPASPAPPRVLGHALLLLGEGKRGATALSRAAELAEAAADAGAWFDLWRTCVSIGDPHGAAIALDEVLTLDPEHDRANAETARRERHDGENAEAAARLDRVLARRPDAAACRLERAVQFLHDDAPEDAMAMLDAGTPAPGQESIWQVHRAHILLRLGQRDAARAVLDAIGTPSPDAAIAYRHALFRMDRDEAAADAMAAALDEPAGDPEDRIGGHFTLVKHWMKQGDPDRAFSHMQRGHALLREREPFDRDAFRRFVDASLTLLDRNRLTDGPRASNASELPVFIVGMPRSGTTLAEQILAAHGSAFGAGERRALGQAFHALGGSRDDSACIAGIAGLDATALDAAAAAYLDELAALAPGKQRIVDKMPGNFRLLGLISLLMPGARVIHCVRDPRDIGLSIFSMRFRGHHPYAHDLDDLGWYIAQQDRLMAHWREAAPIPILRVHLHEWVRQFDPTLRRVLDFVGLPYDEACARFHELDRDVRTASRLQVREAINAKGMSRWRDYAAPLAPLAAALARAREDARAGVDGAASDV